MTIQIDNRSWWQRSDFLWKAWLGIWFSIISLSLFAISEDRPDVAGIAIAATGFLFLVSLILYLLQSQQKVLP